MWAATTSPFLNKKRVFSLRYMLPTGKRLCANSHTLQANDNRYHVWVLPGRLLHADSFFSEGQLCCHLPQEFYLYNLSHCAADHLRRGSVLESVVKGKYSTSEDGSADGILLSCTLKFGLYIYRLGFKIM